MLEREPYQTSAQRLLEPEIARIPIFTPSAPNDPRLLQLAIGVVIVATLYVAREILVPIALAILLSFVLAPLVRLLRRAKLGRVPAVVLAVVVAISVILSLGGLIGTQVSQIAIEIPRYSSTIEAKIAGIRALLVGHLSESFGLLGKRILHASSEPSPAASNPVSPAVPVTTEPKPVPVELRQPDATSFEIGGRIVRPFIEPLTTTGIVFIVAIFILLQQTDLRDRFIRLFGLQDQHRATTALGDAGSRLSHYFLTQLGLNVAFGVFIGASLLLIGVPKPLLWATLAGLFRFVPYVGTLFAGLLPTLFVAAVDPGWGMAIATAALFIVSEIVMGQIVDPLAYGRSTGLSPVSVIIATIFWSWMWGPIGLILSMPLTVCLVVLGRHVQQLEFLEVLMGDQPALTPVEGFYQRILANNLDDTQDHAEVFLRDQPLSAYYDDVAIMGLRLAAHDAKRGVLTLRQLEQIRYAMTRLLGDLADISDVIPTSKFSILSKTNEPVPADPDNPAETSASSGQLEALWSDVGQILCISGRDVLDKPVTAMLTQLLGHHGTQVRVATYEDASHEAIASLIVTDVKMVCITYLELTGSPSHLRYLIRRIRQCLPETPILVGLWPTDDLAVLHDERLRTAIGADHYVTSLREVLTICLAGADEEKQLTVLPAVVAKS